MSLELIFIGTAILVIVVSYVIDKIIDSFK